MNDKEYAEFEVRSEGLCRVLRCVLALQLDASGGDLVIGVTHRDGHFRHVAVQLPQELVRDIETARGILQRSEPGVQAAELARSGMQDPILRDSDAVRGWIAEAKQFPWSAELLEEQ